MVIGGIAAAGGVKRAASVYSRQQHFAERAQKLHIPKTVQIGNADRVSVSQDAITRAQSAAFIGPQASHAAVALAPVQKAIAYQDPRKEARIREAEETSRVTTKADAVTEKVEVGGVSKGA